MHQGNINNLSELGLLADGDEIWQIVLAWLDSLYNQAKKGALTDKDISIPDTGNVRAHIRRIDTISQKGDHFEAHRKFTDVHVCLNGGEKILVGATALLSELDYTGGNTDAVILRAPEDHLGIIEVVMSQGDVVVPMPEDAHLPARYDGINTDVLKVIVKVPVNILK